MILLKFQKIYFKREDQKIEIEKIILDKKLPEKYLQQLLQNIYSKIGITNIDDFKKYLKTKMYLTIMLLKKLL